MLVGLLQTVEASGGDGRHGVGGNGVHASTPVDHPCRRLKRAVMPSRTLRGWSTSGGGGSVGRAGGAGSAGGTVVVVTLLAGQPPAVWAGDGREGVGGTGGFVGKAAAVGDAYRRASTWSTKCRRCAATGMTVAPPHGDRRRLVGLLGPVGGTAAAVAAVARVTPLP